LPIGRVFITSQDKVICPACGTSVVKIKFCSKCGTALFDFVSDSITEINELILKFNNLFDKLRFKIYRKLSFESEKLLFRLREEIVKFTEEYHFLVKRTITAHQETIVCNRCGFRVKNAARCSKCNSPLQIIKTKQIDNRILRTIELQDRFELLIKPLKDDFAETDLKTSNEIKSILQQMLDKQIKLHDYLHDIKTGKRAPLTTPKPVIQEKIAQIKEIVTEKPTKTIPLEIEFIPKQPTTTDITPIVLEGTRPPEEVDLAREETFFTRFERGLVHYWFFYLSVFLLTAGIIITVVFVVKEISSVNEQMIIIYSIGAAILIIGELIAILSRRRQKREKIKRELEAEGSSELFEDKKGKFPLPAFGSVIVLIGLLVLYTAGIIGFGSPLPRSIFIYISFGVTLLSIGLGILNNSEMTTLAGFIPIITVVILDFTLEGTPVLNEAGVFVALTIPILLATITAIFFKKWWGAVIMVTILPVIICIPTVSTRMGLEFIPLLLIPLMVLLITRYDKDVIPYTHKKILVILSLILPIVGLTIISFPSLNYLATEKPWARIYPVEIIITALAIVCISFFYQFIQEKYLNIKSNVCVFYYISQGTVGVFSIIMVVLNRGIFYGFLSSILCFSFFFIVGCLGVIKAFKERLTSANTIISFAIAEIHAIFMFTLFSIPPNVKLGLQFLTAIIFTVLAIITTALSKWLNISKYLFISWIVISAVNNILFIFIQKANYWFIFSSLAIFLVLSLINKEPNKEIPNYIGQISVGILSIIMVFANLGNPSNIIFNAIFFVAFFVLGILSAIFKNYFTLIGTIISFTIAQIHAILLLTLFNITNPFQIVIYFLIGISFILLSIIFIALNKKIEIPKQIFTTWIVYAVINITILAFIQKLSIWFSIGAILIFLVLPILKIKPNVEIPYFIGLGSIGVLTSILAGLNHAHEINYIFIIICFCVFFTIGVLGLIKKLQKYYTLLGTLISLVFAEILVILGLVFINTSASYVQYAFYIILAVSFLILSLITIVLRKQFGVSEYVFLGWIIAILANTLLVIFMHKVSIWFAFALILLFFAMTTIEMEPNTEVVSIIGKCSVGALAIILVTTSLNNPSNYIYNFIFYLLFFIIGSIGLVKALRKQFSLVGTLISFGFAEVLILLSMILQKTTTAVQISFYFIMAISILIIAILSIALVKFLEVHEYLYLGFIGASLVNSILLLVMNKVSNWFAFVVFILFFAVTAIELKPNTDRNLIAGKSAVGIFSIVMILTTLGDPNNYIYNSVFFVLFFIIGVVGLLNVLKKYFNNYGTYISIGCAEVLTILLLILMNPLNAGQISFYFIIAISFNFIAMISIVFTKVFIRSDVLLVGWIICSAINTSILGLFGKISPWFTFVSIILLMFLVAINNMPLFSERQDYWRTIALVTSIIALIVTIILVFTGRLSYFNHEILVVFLIYALANVPVFVNWKNEEVAIHE